MPCRLVSLCRGALFLTLSTLDPIKNVLRRMLWRLLWWLLLPLYNHLHLLHQDLLISKIALAGGLDWQAEF
ncbi:unnamed protein product [Arctia plantaginis]|uniref:Uncharacterized protein n=1 Tax=Arctia plantaginis TaxID=874455 RepID=A0A8S1A587_ARCPL|nr:unnamed protein product [Arctia plantaginis]